jgi:fibronectin type 3 domain-containing protein
VTLSWARPEQTGGASSLTYVVLRGDDGTVLSTIRTLEDEYTMMDAEVEVGRSYYYSIMALNMNGGEGPRSPSLYVIVATTPGPVIGLTATAEEVKVVLAWSQPLNDGGLAITEFIVLRRTDGPTLVEIGRSRTMGFEDPFVDPGRTYYYVVQAVNGKGPGESSETASAIILGKPGAPRNLTATFEDGGVNLKWEAPSLVTSPVTGYIVTRWTSGGDRQVVARLGPVTVFEDRSVGAGTKYHYSVKAVSDMGEGPEAGPVTLEIRKSPVWPYALMAILALATLVVLAFMARRTRGTSAKAPPASGDEGQGADGEEGPKAQAGPDPGMTGEVPEEPPLPMEATSEDGGKVA